jgi:hypothetical protein
MADGLLPIRMGNGRIDIDARGGVALRFKF